MRESATERLELWELRAKKGAKRMEEEPREAAVNKGEGRDNTVNLKGMIQ